MSSMDTLRVQSIKKNAQAVKTSSCNAREKSQFGTKHHITPPPPYGDMYEIQYSLNLLVTE
jgi:hypothetical protein